MIISIFPGRLQLKPLNS